MPKSYLIIPNRLGANGGGARLNQWSVVMDIMLEEQPAQRIAILNVDPTNSRQALATIYRDGAFGEADVSHGEQLVQFGVFARLTVTRDVFGVIHYYLNGQYVKHHHANPEKDSRYAIGDKFLVLAGPMEAQMPGAIVRCVTLFNYTLSRSDVRDLGAAPADL
eukprot:TRINITY_DN7147_c0_g1_i10.p1 TRINITY_DN7147_c0_g1~~TRINITY_DN7147_c0_g1_i10.p1  ORF type:complete len:163 (-),score=46.62 TRINITY_DN7147_c0_g1_i10:89-577(-)